jgi:hypothetical protein
VDSFGVTALSRQWLHIWPEGVPLSGGGLALVSAFGPAIGLTIAHSVRVGLAIVGLMMLVAPAVAHLARQTRGLFNRKSAQIHPSNAAPTTQGNIDAASGLEKLFAVEKSEVKLRFLPDGQNRSADIVLLLLYGYKSLLGIDRVETCVLKCEVDQDTLSRTPSVMQMMTLARFQQESLADMVAARIPGRVSVSGLSRIDGGFMSLTDVGFSSAKRLAAELIGRAD